ncbi:MAG: hypothetical protein GY898_23170 [Proteobacteria bacterium]|nr:hypothetical protein [Pseudomonadota bacterium]
MSSRYCAHKWKKAQRDGVAFQVCVRCWTSRPHDWEPSRFDRDEHGGDPAYGISLGLAVGLLFWAVVALLAAWWWWS